MQAAPKDNLAKVGAILFGSATPKPAPKPRPPSTASQTTKASNNPEPPPPASRPVAPYDSDPNTLLLSAQGTASDAVKSVFSLHVLNALHMFDMYCCPLLLLCAFMDASPCLTRKDGDSNRWVLYSRSHWHNPASARVAMAPGANVAASPVTKAAAPTPALPVTSRKPLPKPRRAAARNVLERMDGMCQGKCTLTLVRLRLSIQKVD